MLNMKKQVLQKEKEPGYIGLELTKEDAAKLVAKADTMQRQSRICLRYNHLFIP